MVKTFTVQANKINPTGLKFKKGDLITFTTNLSQKWKDANIECDCTGWDSPLYNLFSGLKDVPTARFMYMCGKIGNTKFLIGRTLSLVVPEDGELSLFANDICFMRWNNTGSIDVDIAGSGV